VSCKIVTALSSKTTARSRLRTSIGSLQSREFCFVCTSRSRSRAQAPRRWQDLRLRQSMLLGVDSEVRARRLPRSSISIRGEKRIIVPRQDGEISTTTIRCLLPTFQVWDGSRSSRLRQSKAIPVQLTCALGRACGASLACSQHRLFAHLSPVVTISLDLHILPRLTTAILPTMILGHHAPPTMPHVRPSQGRHLHRPCSRYLLLLHSNLLLSLIFRIISTYLRQYPPCIRCLSGCPPRAVRTSMDSMARFRISHQAQPSHPILL